MAIVSEGFFANITLVDFKGNPASKEYQLTSATYAEAVTDTALIITALLAVSIGVVASYDIRQHFVEDALVLPADNAIASEYVSVTALKAGAGQEKANYSIPMPDEAIMSGNQLIVTNTEVGAYNDLFLATGPAFISDGESLAAGDPLRGVRATRYRRYQ